MKSRHTEELEASFDLSISDLMSSLLMVFILLLVTTLLSLQQEFRQKSDIAEEYRSLQAAIYDDLMAEFEKDLPGWGAVIDPTTLSFRFREPEILFEGDSFFLKNEFARILSNFFPRYISVLYPNHVDIIEEIKIEGHTAPLGNDDFFKDMKLSQNRANSVLEFILTSQVSVQPNSFNDIQYSFNNFTLEERNWIKQFISATGFSYSRPIFQEEVIKIAESRRVEFRIITNSEQQIERLLGVTATNP